MAAGFNGARLHQKVFEERFLYHADRLGYLVWGEFPDWGCGGIGPEYDHQQPAPPTSPSGWRPWSATTRTRHRRLVPAERDRAADHRPHHRWTT